MVYKNVKTIHIYKLEALFFHYPNYVSFDNQ